MPDNTTPERTQLLQLYGAEIVYSPGAEGSNGAIRLAQELAAADPNLFMPYQYGNEANPAPTRQGTGPEILAEVPELDAFVAGLGNRRDADRRRSLPAASAPCRAGHRRGAAARRAGAGLRSLEEVRAAGARRIGPGRPAAWSATATR